MVAAVGVGSAAAWILNVLIPGSMQTIGALTDVPRGLPGIKLPGPSMIPVLIVPACSLALVGLVQGAAISGSIPNANGRFADASADFRGQGIANLAAGLFQGMPVGGSISATALVRTAARSALANLSAAVVMAVAILAAGPVFGHVAMASLAGLLILVGVRTFRLHQIMLVWRTGPVQATVLGVTFLLTVVVPLRYAALSGVGLSVILYVIRQSNRVVVKRWEFDEGEIMPRETNGGAVVIRLRGKDEIGSAFLKVLEGYSTRVSDAGGILMLAGVSSTASDQLRATGALKRLGEGRSSPSGRGRVGDSIHEAVDAANRWREGRTHPQ